jgi:hypothetical protein
MTRGRNILTEKMFVFLQKASDTLKMEKMINTLLDTVAVRSMDVTEALQVGVGGPLSPSDSLSTCGTTGK